MIGNPPYIRFQGFTGDARASGLAAALAQGVRLSKLSSRLAPFVVHAACAPSHGRPTGLGPPAELSCRRTTPKTCVTSFCAGSRRLASY